MTQRSGDSRYLPLSVKAFHLMLALAEGPLNGYRLGLAVEERSGGAVRLGPATLYENLNRLKGKGLIREATVDAATDGRGQRFWELSPLGVEVLRAEVERLRRDLRVADSLSLLREA